MVLIFRNVIKVSIVAVSFFLWPVLLFWPPQSAAGVMEVCTTNALEPAKLIQDPYLEAEALYRIADVHARVADYNRSFKVLEEIKEPYFKAIFLVKVGSRASNQGDLTQAERMRKLAREITESIEEKAWMSMAYIKIAKSYADSRQMDQAGQVFLKAKEVIEKVKDIQWQADLFVELGKAYVENGRREEGIKLLDLAFERAKTFEDAYTKKYSDDGKISVLDRIAEEYRINGEDDKAREVEEAIVEVSTKAAEKKHYINILLRAGKYGEALKTAEEIENLHTRTHTLITIADFIWEKEGSQPIALEMLKKAFAAAQKLEDAHVQSKALSPIVIFYAKKGYFNEAFAVLEKMKDVPVRDMTLSRVAGLYAEVGKYLEAKELIEKIENLYYQSVAMDYIIGKYARDGNKARAVELAANAIEISQDIKNTYRQNEMYSRLSRRYAEIGQYEQALEITKQIKDSYHKSTALYWIVYWAGEEKQFDWAIKVAEKIDDPYYQASAFTWLAEKTL